MLCVYWQLGFVRFPLFSVSLLVRIFFKKIGAALCRYFKALLVPPLFDVLVMSRKKHRRNCLSLPDLGAGIVRILKKSAVNALVSKAHLVGEDSRTHSCNSVRKHTSGKFTAREHIVPYR